MCGLSDLVTTAVSTTKAPKDVHILPLANYTPKGFADVIVKRVLRWRDYSGLIPKVQCIHKADSEKQEDQGRRVKTDERRSGEKLLAVLTEKCS